MIVCHVVLYSEIPPEGGGRHKDWAGRMWFRRVPVKGEVISLERESDWPTKLRGNTYRVGEIIFAQSCPEDRNPPPPGVAAIRTGVA